MKKRENEEKTKILLAHLGALLHEVVSHRLLAKRWPQLLQATCSIVMDAGVFGAVALHICPP